jgi:hypothetical protein
MLVHLAFLKSEEAFAYANVVGLQNASTFDQNAFVPAALVASWQAQYRRRTMKSASFEVYFDTQRYDRPCKPWVKRAIVPWLSRIFSVQR